MKSGMDKDDQWKMVEDELYAIAHEHTKSMHAKEYEERMAAAKISAQSKKEPVLKQSLLTETIVKPKLPPQRRKGKTEDESDDEVLDEEGNNVLEGTAVGALLMSPSKKETRLLRDGARRKANTRAAAGLKPYESFVSRDSQSQYTQNPGESFVENLMGKRSNTLSTRPRTDLRSSPTPAAVPMEETELMEDTEDDDLDAVVHKKPKVKHALTEEKTTRVRVSSVRLATPPRKVPSKNRTAPKPILKSSSPPRPDVGMDDSFIDPAEEFLMNLMSKKKMQRVKTA